MSGDAAAGARGTGARGRRVGRRGGRRAVLAAMVAASLGDGALVRADRAAAQAPGATGTPPTAGAGSGVAPRAARQAIVERRSPRGIARMPLGSGEESSATGRAAGGDAIARGAAEWTVDYGRPSVGGRPIFGALVPWGVPWRTGDDEATVLATPVRLRLAGYDLDPGRYSLFLVPAPPPRRARLIVHRRPDLWGAFDRDPRWDVPAPPDAPQAGEVAVVTLERSVETLTFVWEALDGRHGRLWVGFEKLAFSIPWERLDEPAPAADPPRP